ncbi:MAG: cytochrome c maturation protein CcmE [Bacteroidia bacterium]|jgi:cytochrome c-type biogenesis protein CcmE|nr:cytochrome c maturation protein CcmE [Bacteroidia bacterium]MDG2042559.1 cytochrome c maturation protein CcmE [Bacteroidia bacterium]|tara:strand:- start:1476 stop:1874 length:399 start_codon:yes stop_codon:yes gene_type:complete
MKPKVIVLLIMLAVAIAAIMTTYSEAEKSSTFAEADANPNETFHITGFLVKEKPMEYNPQIDPNYFSFYLKDKNGNIRKVVSTNPKQQDFERAETVNMYGRSDGEVFRASKVMPKCPSKYKDEQNNNSAQSS